MKMGALGSTKDQTQAGESDLQIQSRYIQFLGLLQEHLCEITMFDLISWVIFFFFAKVEYLQLEGWNLLISK